MALFCRSLQEATETLEKANERHREVTAMVKDTSIRLRMWPAAVFPATDRF